MIIKKWWRKYERNGHRYKDCMGVFLLGFIPIYIEITPWRS